MINSFASIPSPHDNGFHVFGLFFHAYGICYVFAVAAAIVISRWRWGSVGGKPELVDEVALYGFPAGLIGGRIYFLITTPSQIPDHWYGAFAIWDGGLGIWGGIAGGVAAGIWVLKRRLGDWDQVRAFLNACTPCLLVAQAIGRIGNYFNQELFGKPTSLPWGLKIDPSHRPPGFLHYTTFQPTFLYEIIWDLAIAALLIFLHSRKKVKAPGIMALYVAAYSAFRIFEESLRIDYSEHILGERLNFWIALIGTIAGLLWFAQIQWRLLSRLRGRPVAAA